MTSQILPRHTRDDQPHVPPTKPYELSALAADLVVLARYLLKPGGRLVFFLPTVIDEYKELDLDSLLCDGMQVVANSLQDFGAWGRRVRVHHGRNACRCSLLPLLWIAVTAPLTADYNLQSHVSIVPTTDVRFACCADAAR
jgi:hypothetical protein